MNEVKKKANKPGTETEDETDEKEGVKRKWQNARRKKAGESKRASPGCFSKTAETE